jgi:hypothetical protein
MHDGLKIPLLAWLLCVISLNFKLTKVFVICVQGVKEVNQFCFVPRSHLYSLVSQFCWEDLGLAFSLLLINFLQRIWVPPFSFDGWFHGKYVGLVSFLLLVDFVENILGYCLSLISLTTSWAPFMILWILFVDQIYLWLKGFLCVCVLGFHFQFQELPIFYFFSFQFCLDHLMGSLLSLVDFISNSFIVLYFSHTHRFASFFFSA